MVRRSGRPLVRCSGIVDLFISETIRAGRVRARASGNAYIAPLLLAGRGIFDET